MNRIVVLLAVLAGHGAHADTPLPGGGVVECFCTDASGGRVELGRTICLHVDGRAFRARCEMSLNNPVWRDTGESCATSRLDRLDRLEPMGDPTTG